jgi:glycosyltransferase involved in cell wall biosynthesis
MNLSERKPYFSVVIPAYNAEKLIEEALDSVLKQTFKDYEIIVVDDGSTDNTSGSAEAFLKNKGVNFKVIRQENKKIGAARNRGIRAAEGLYVAFLDADDVWYPKKLERVFDAFSKMKDVCLVCHDEDVLGENKKIGKNIYGPYKENMYEYLLFERNCLSTSATVVRREKLFEAGLFSEDLRFNGVEDYELWLRLSKICRFYFLHEVLGGYKLSEGGISRDVGNQVRSETNVLEHNFSKLKIPANERWKVEKRYARLFTSTGFALHKQGMFRESRSWYLKAIRRYPLFYKAYAALLLSIIGLRL